MTPISSKFSLATASLGLMIGTLVQANPVQAAAFNFTVSIISGDLAGETAQGSFGFNETDLTGVDEEFLPVSSLQLNFRETNFTEADGLFGTEAAFLEGEFLGLSYSVEEPELSFSFVPGFFDIGEAFLAYELTTGIGGAGDVIYTVAPDTVIPEPSGVGGLFLVFGMFARKLLVFVKKKQVY